MMKENGIAINNHRTAFDIADIKIVPYKEEYLDDTRQVCYSTSTSYHTPERRPLLWACYHDYYVNNEPETCFVALNKAGRAIGYTICAPDFQRYEKIFRKNFMPYLMTLDLKQVQTMEHEIMAYKEHADKFPAHLHINLLPEYQAHGIGGMLLAALFEKLKQEKVRGVCLETSPKKIYSHKLYKKNGFEIIQADDDKYFFAKDFKLKNLNIEKHGRAPAEIVD